MNTAKIPECIGGATDMRNGLRAGAASHEMTNLNMQAVYGGFLQELRQSLRGSSFFMASHLQSKSLR